MTKRNLDGFAISRITGNLNEAMRHIAGAMAKLEPSDVEEACRLDSALDCIQRVQRELLAPSVDVETLESLERENAELRDRLVRAVRDGGAA